MNESETWLYQSWLLLKLDQNVTGDIIPWARKWLTWYLESRLSGSISMWMTHPKKLRKKQYFSSMSQVKDICIWTFTADQRKECMFFQSDGFFIVDNHLPLLQLWIQQIYQVYYHSKQNKKIKNITTLTCFLMIDKISDRQRRLVITSRKF